MGDIERLIDHLLTKDYSIDTVRSIVEHLRTTREDLMRILKDPRYEDFFQLLRPSKNATEKIDKIALTLDVSSPSNCSRRKWFFFSFSVVHITVINVKMSPVHFSIFVRSTSDRCIQNVQIAIVHLITTSNAVRTIEKLSKLVGSRFFRMLFSSASFAPVQIQIDR